MSAICIPLRTTPTTASPSSRHLSPLAPNCQQGAVQSTSAARAPMQPPRIKRGISRNTILPGQFTASETHDVDELHIEPPEENSEADLVLKAQTVAYVQTFFFGGRAANFVSMYMDRDFYDAYKQQAGTDKELVLRSLLLAVLIIVLPAVYGHSLMTDPCKPVVEQIKNQTVQVRQLGCSVQRFMESPSVVMVGPLTALGFLVLYKITAEHVSPRLWSCRQAVHRQLQLFLESRVWLLRYQPYSDRGFPLAAAMFLYLLVIVEFLIIGALLRDAFATAIGLALGEAFLLCAMHILKPPQAVIEMIEAELCMFGTADRMLLRLFRHQRSVFWVTMAELEALWNMEAVGRCGDKRKVLRDDMLHGRLYRYGGKPDQISHPQKESGATLEERVGKCRTVVRQIYIADHPDNPLVSVDGRIHYTGRSELSEMHETWFGGFMKKVKRPSRTLEEGLLSTTDRSDDEA